MGSRCWKGRKASQEGGRSLQSTRPEHSCCCSTARQASSIYETFQAPGISHSSFLKPQSGTTAVAACSEKHNLTCSSSFSSIPVAPQTRAGRLRLYHQEGLVLVVPHHADREGRPDAHENQHLFCVTGDGGGGVFQSACLYALVRRAGGCLRFLRIDAVVAGG